MKIVDVWSAVLMMASVASFFGDVFAGTLEVTTCSVDIAGADTFIDDIEEELPTFSFCDGGTFCNSTDEIMLPPNSGINESGSTISIDVDLGYTPTTLDIRKPDGSTDAWCITTVTWEGGGDLLGRDGWLWLDWQIGDGGCMNGLLDGTTIACRPSWRFFNLDGASDYKYEVLVEACAGITVSSVEVSFCSYSMCDGSAGDIRAFTLPLNDVDDDGWTHAEFTLPYNPLAMRLSDPDENWCVDQLIFNGFPVIQTTTSTAHFGDIVNSERALIFTNIQKNDMAVTPAPMDPTSEPSVTTPTGQTDEGSGGDSRWLDAVWEICVTVVGAAVVAASAAGASFLCRRRCSGALERMAPSGLQAQLGPRRPKP